MEFHSKNKFERLVPLVGFIIRKMNQNILLKQLIPDQRVTDARNLDAGSDNMILQPCHTCIFLTLPVSVCPDSAHKQNGGETPL